MAYRMQQNGIGQFITPGVGNATSWGSQAAAKGLSVSKDNPAVGDVAWWSSAAIGGEGHVAYVESVNSAAGTFVVSEDNYGGDFDWRTYRISEVSGFIHVGNATPFGALDSAKGGAGEITVKGWAIDRSVPTTPIRVHAYVGAPAGSGGEGHDLGTASVERNDVGQAYSGTGNNHGYSTTFTTNLRGTQTVYLYAINQPTGHNPLIGQATVTISSPDPIGNLDDLDSPGGKVHVRGWAADASSGSSSIAIHVYVGAPAGSAGTDSSSGTTGISRPDVAKLYPWAGTKAGYDFTFKTTKRGAQPVYVYAINVGQGGNKLIGQGTVTIADGPFTKASATISGTARVGKKLTAKAVFSPSASYTYRWYRNGTAITRATKSTYTVTPKDYNTKITVKVKATLTGYTTTTVASKATAKVALGTQTVSSTPHITGTTRVGKKLTVHTGTWSGSGKSIAVTWYRDGKKVKSGTSKTYTLSSKDKAAKIKAKVSYKRTGYKTVFKSTAATAKIAS
ncbi:CHAP domain-containing protein [Tessaracoccus palaemonis]|uniref:CHAP domain-containing protein n=1 Tax=Tessaracoccus palaemonis TaxID=2829499 RepID=A0ABX8SLB1_9ACTN|nr:CHAP domain-containing protein [Tessaracoccus palaemonis]